MTEQNLHWDRVQTLLPPYDVANFPIILDENDVVCDTPGAYEAQCTAGVERTYAESMRGSGSASLRARRSSPLNEPPSIMVTEKWRRAVTSGRGGLGASNNWAHFGLGFSPTLPCFVLMLRVGVNGVGFLKNWARRAVTVTVTVL